MYEATSRALGLLCEVHVLGTQCCVVSVKAAER